jgi:hypothetical protein
MNIRKSNPKNFQLNPSNEGACSILDLMPVERIKSTQKHQKSINHEQNKFKR